MAEESSAQMEAPNQVSAPAAIQTSSMPPKLGTARLTSDGWTKIDEPTIVPTTIAVACVNPIVRASFAVTPRIVSPRCQMGVRWVSDGCQMGVRWVSDGCQTPLRHQMQT